MRLSRIALLSFLVPCVVIVSASAQDYVQYVGQRETGCSGGKEIKDERNFSAPNGKYFKNYRLDAEGPILNRAGNAGQVGCSILGTGTSNGYVTSVHAFAHADCGHSGGPTIQAYCRFSADLGDQ